MGAGIELGLSGFSKCAFTDKLLLNFKLPFKEYVTIIGLYETGTICVASLKSRKRELS